MHKFDNRFCTRTSSIIFLIWAGFMIGGTILSSCNRPGDSDQAHSTVQRYFSLEQYFAEQVRELQQSRPEILKSVEANGKTETRSVKISSWEKELAPFTESDINKAAWTNSYSVDSGEHKIVYESIEPGLRTRQIVLTKAGSGEITGIFIHNKISNLLYTSDEQLHFYPDSLYEIVREQDVRVVGYNRYRISGQLTSDADTVAISDYPDRRGLF